MLHDGVVVEYIKRKLLTKHFPQKSDKVKKHFLLKKYAIRKYKRETLILVLRFTLTSWYRWNWTDHFVNCCYNILEITSFTHSLVVVAAVDMIYIYNILKVRVYQKRWIDDDHKIVIISVIIFAFVSVYVCDMTGGT